MSRTGTSEIARGGMIRAGDVVLVAPRDATRRRCLVPAAVDLIDREPGAVPVATLSLLAGPRPQVMTLPLPDAAMVTRLYANRSLVA